MLVSYFKLLFLLCRFSRFSSITNGTQYVGNGRRT